MSDKKILIADKLDAAGLRAFENLADDCQGISAGELLQVIAPYQALVVRSRTKVTAELLAAAPNLKVVGRAGVGVDNIDLQAARQHGVKVVNTPQSTSLAVAEHTLALMLAMARSLPQADGAMKSGQWIKKSLIGIELAGKILGIIGVGNIGQAVAQRAAAFGMQVLGYDALLSPEELQNRDTAPVSLEELYAQADFITLHVPLVPETQGMINSDSLRQMKPGVHLICTARGGIIDEPALLAALESGQVAGAALDVFADEPPGLTPLVAHERVIASPHIAAQTVEAQRRAAEDIAAEILRALRGEPLRWKVV